ncbi:MAG: cation transporter [Phycisphaerales bacterium]|jgi:copper chaperone
MLPGKAETNPAAPVDVHTPGEYASTKEFYMNTTTQTVGTTTLNIDGMSCGHCVQAVTKALSAVPGVKVNSVAVGSAVIEAADGRAAGQALAALGAAGYPARAVGDAAPASASRPTQSGGGCCGGAKAMTPGGAPGAKTSGGCCG